MAISRPERCPVAKDFGEFFRVPGARATVTGEQWRGNSHLAIFTASRTARDRSLEIRWVTIGANSFGSMIVVAWTQRDDVRLISALYANGTKAIGRPALGFAA